MDKKAIKTFAIESRKKLMDEVKYQASLLGITAEGISEPVEKSEGMEVYDIGASTPNTIYDEAIKQRESLVKRINEKGYDNVVEEVAYTWFNRIIAIRFMEVNDYLPTRIRVLSSQTTGKIEPDIVTEAPHIDLDFTDDDIEQIYQLKNDNKLDELFRLLFIKQCNKLNEILPELFEKTADYTELLLSISFTNEDAIIRQLVDNIAEEDFNEQVEIIGWFYQYYITELVDFVYDGSMKRKKIPKELLPAATQIFTPDWPVKYMVENSLGKLWVEQTPNTDIQKNWKYYITQNDETTPKYSKLNPKDLKILDPAMGSGHILIYIFEILMQIYTSVGYSNGEAAISIIESNIYGIDVDERAYQLSYFALMMKVRQYNRKAFKKDLKLNLTTIHESNNISVNLIESIFKEKNTAKKDFKNLLETFKDAKEYGSIIKLNHVDIFEIFIKIENYVHEKSLSSLSPVIENQDILTLEKILKQTEILLNKYDIVITNPPYLNRTRMDHKLSEYTKREYPNTKSDLSAIFYQKAIDEFCKKDGYISFITTNSWMFLKTFENFRKQIIETIKLESIVDFGSELFDGKVGHNLITAYISKKTEPSKNFISIKLTDYCYSRRDEKEKEFFNAQNRYFSSQEDFLKIPGNPIAYWANDNVIKAFSNGEELLNIAPVKQGLATADNNRFLRFWYEINIQKSGFSFENSKIAEKSQKKWFPYNKGGSFRKWYGNQDYVVNWESNGTEIKNFSRSVIRNEEYYFKSSITWSFINSSYFGVRFSPQGFIFDVQGSSVFPSKNLILYITGFMCSKLSTYFLSFLNPTLSFQVGNIGTLPIIIVNDDRKNKLESVVESCIEISKEDWDNYETSWNFLVHPLIQFGKDKESLVKSFYKWNKFSKLRFKRLYKLEEYINKELVDIYNLNEEINPKSEENLITISKANLSRDIKSLISYAVGCMLGRYSLDEEGLIYAGGQWNPSKYSKFLPDDDNIIPILDTEYFKDDIVGRFVEFVKVTFGEETLEENLDFIAQALKKKGTTSREVIRNYFLTDFYKDHVKTYKKHPIYWLFDSGRNNGFKALIYMHRYEGDLVARVRTDYLHKTQKALETAIAHNDRIIETSTTASEKSKAVKAKNKLVKQSEETRKYDEALAHIANQKIEIDLDDGVKVNYAKFQGVEVSKEGKKVTKIDLLKKI